MFREYHNQAKNVKKQLDAAQARFEVTEAAYNIEKDLFDARGRDEAAKEADRIF